MSEVLDENGDLIAWMDDDYWLWASRCESCAALGTERCLFPDVATKNTKKVDICCEYEYQCVCCVKFGTAQCPHLGIATKETYVDELNCIEDSWKPQ